MALPESAEYLAQIGIPREKLLVTGIPVDPAFEKRVDQAEARGRLGLDPKARILLIAAGGYGLGPVEQLVKDLLTLAGPWQIVAIAGKSEKLKKRLEHISQNAGKLAGGGGRLVTIGFTQEMDQYMAAADLLVGKAGGLTTSEALARMLPMAIVEPIPGQEARNADHLLEAGAAVRCNNLPAAAWKIAGLLDRPEKLMAMKKAAAEMAQPDASRVIVEDALLLLH